MDLPMMFITNFTFTKKKDLLIFIILFASCIATIINHIHQQMHTIFYFKLSPCLIFSVLSFGCFPGVWFLLADVSELSICSIFKADDLEVM
jgi:hypothetical protein